MNTPVQAPIHAPRRASQQDRRLFGALLGDRGLCSGEIGERGRLLRGKGRGEQ